MIYVYIHIHKCGPIFGNMIFAPLFSKVDKVDKVDLFKFIFNQCLHIGLQLFINSILRFGYWSIFTKLNTH